MKNGIRFFGLVAAVAIIGFGFAGCDNGNDDGGNGDGGGDGGNGKFTFVKVGNEYTLTGHDGKKDAGGGFTSGSDLRDVVIPGTHEGLPVTAIGDRALMYRFITELTIPDSVKTIGEKAFYGNRFTSVTIPHSVKTIGANPFSGTAGSGIFNYVTIGADVNLAEGSKEGGGDWIWEDFVTFYNNGKKAGTYTRPDSKWTFKE